ncbi:MAG: patatin-like phospholipase family protein [Bacteroidota bacterium]
MAKKTSTKKVKIALQGGGAHGAYTWGVLDRLLEEKSLEIVGLSGTSAGALNAAVLLTGLLEGGRDKAKENLYQLWRKVNHVSAFSKEDVKPFLSNLPIWSQLIEMNYTLSRQWMKSISSFYSFSPYEFNPLDINPLRKIVDKLTNFELINKPQSPFLWVGTTNVQNGQLKLFSQPELSLDAVMASACLPNLYQAVEIEGVPYWDGGYTSNPPLIPLVRETVSPDLVLIQINPFIKCETPREYEDIQTRLNEINFNNSLLKELYHISDLKRVQKALNLSLGDIFLHRIEAEEELGELGLDSKYDTRWTFLTKLRDIGYQKGEAWLNENLQHIGKKNTLAFEKLIDQDLIRDAQKNL